MAVMNQSHLNGSTSNGVVNALSIPTSFKIHAVDGYTSEEPHIKGDIRKNLQFAAYSTEGVDEAAKAVPGELNILAKLTGQFYGTGLNMIFRPSYGNIRRNNVLEYNVTEEVTQFLEDIGDVPNRGLGRQKDVIVKAVPYMQHIKDFLNPVTGQADRENGIPIHFETGMFCRTPPTDVRPEVPQGTISRLASIPHGTAINCQGFEPDMSKPTPGKPVFSPVSILPFPMGTPEDQVTFLEFFPQLNLKKAFNLRIPQEIKVGGVLTEPLMLDPNQLLIQFNENSTKKSIREHYFFKVHSDPKVSKIPGGGTANTAFLSGSGLRDGSQNVGPNANGVNVGCNYWISTVEYDVLLPEGDYSSNKQTMIVDSEARKEERAEGKWVISPQFAVELDRKIPPNTVVKLDATQIQYSQNVTLDFDDMGWPHISVATLSPKDPVPVKADQINF